MVGITRREVKDRERSQSQRALITVCGWIVDGWTNMKTFSGGTWYMWLGEG